MLDELAAAALDAVTPPPDDVVVPLGARRVVFSAAEIAEWLSRAAVAVIPINQRRQRLRAIAGQELLRRTGRDDAWPDAGPLRRALDKAWPSQQPVRLVDRFLAERFEGHRGRRRAWSVADQLLVDEANSLLNGPPQAYGHVVVDEAQDHSAAALRVIGRRSPATSMTLVGDVAQSTAPGGQERWDAVFDALATGVRPALRTIAALSIGYRVPEPVLVEANRLLPFTGVDTTASRSVRTGGPPPRWSTTSPTSLAADVANVVGRAEAPPPPHGGRRRSAPPRGAGRGAGRRRVRHGRSRPPTRPRRRPAVRTGAGQGPRVRRRRRRRTRRDLRWHPRGARLLYVAMTRAVQELAVVGTGSADMMELCSSSSG